MSSRSDEHRAAVRTVHPSEAPVVRANNQQHTCYYCDQMVAGPPQEYDCPKRPKPNENH